MHQTNVQADNSEQTEKDFDKLLQRSNEYLEGWKRAKADYLNLKRQSEKDKEEIAGLAMGAVIIDLLPVKTNLDRAWKHLPKELEDNDWIKGLSQVRAQFDAMLATIGIEQIDPVGRTFTPDEHEAIEKQSDPTVPDDQVVATLEPGYKLRGNVIVPAKVKVNSHVDQDINKETKGGE